jgi:hypothetical protein
VKVENSAGKELYSQYLKFLDNAEVIEVSDFSDVDTS